MACKTAAVKMQRSNREIVIWVANTALLHYYVGIILTSVCSSVYLYGIKHHSAYYSLTLIFSRQPSVHHITISPALHKSVPFL